MYSDLNPLAFLLERIFLKTFEKKFNAHCVCLNFNPFFITGITSHQIDTLETGMKLALIGKSYMF